MAKKIIPWSLDETMEKIARFSVKHAAQEEQSLAELYCLDRKNEMTVVGMAVGGGDQIAWTARSMVFMLQPVHAILVTEGWTARRDLPQSDPDVRRAMMGEIAISDMPREKRGEMMILYGESADGERNYQLWDLKSSGPPEYKRTGAERTVYPEATSEVKMHSRFEPLFMVEKTLRDITGDEPTDDQHMLALRELSTHVSPSRRRELVRGVIATLLASGMGMSTREWESWVSKSHADSITKIVTEGGPAI